MSLDNHYTWALFVKENIDPGGTGLFPFLHMFIQVKQGFIKHILLEETNFLSYNKFIAVI